LRTPPPDNLPEPRQPHVSLQRPLHIDPTNAPWGDALQYLKTHDHFRVISKNISTLNTQNLDMQAIATELQSCDASIFLAQETNIPWNPSNINMVCSHCQNILRHQKLAVSSSTDSANGTHQPGGTLTLAIGKWASRIIKWGSDEPLGRWSYLELAGQHGMRLIVVSAYRVCPQPFDATTTTVTAQQTRILLQQGVPNPNPREQFITDLIQQITTWRQHHKEVLIGMDANENIDDPQSKIMRLFNETDLIDLHYHRHPAATKPATHQRGSHPIDIMIGSPLLASTLTHAWILPFGEPALIKGDHRLLGLDFNADALFGSRPSLPSQGPLRGVNSRHEQHVHQFCKRVVKQCNRFRLAERTSTLFEQAILAPPDLSELDAIDDTLTKILIRSDKQCRPLSSTPWSPTLQKAYLIHRYWSLTFTAKKTERDLSSSLKSIAQRLPPDALDASPDISLTAKLRKAQKELKAAKREADKLRQLHLEALLNKAILDNQQKRTKALTYLIRAERNRLCYARFRQHTKPKASGGLAYITVPDNNGDPQPLVDQQDVESTLLEYSRNHFAQAEGSPFTVDPINRLLQYDGLTPYGDRITQGQLPQLHVFDEPTRAILQNLKRKVPAAMSPVTTLDYNTLLKGIQKWPERTTTSPSGRHLGIYKALGKHVVDQNKRPADKGAPEPENGPIQEGRDVLYLVFDLMTLALRHNYPLKRWRKVWTIFIEKELGNPDINRLRCIMIFEADWQLFLKYFSSYGFLPKTEAAGQLVQAQGGSRKGRSAIDQATQQVVETEITHLQQQTTMDLYLDLRMCFDLMVEACHNLACRRHGAEDAYLRLHARTHQLMRYFIRHKFGVSQEYNTFSQYPWHGSGQGAADAALRYIVLSDTLIDAYHSKIDVHRIYDPAHHTEILRSLKAFIDDVVIHTHQSPGNSLDDLRLCAQNKLNWWDQLVKVTGGELNPKKCCGMLYTWVPDKRGILQLHRPNLPQPFLSLPFKGVSQPITILDNHEGTRYLGLYLTADRNMTPMESHLWNKAKSYTMAFNRTPMNRREAGVLYRSCFLPALTYPFPAVWLSDRFLNRIQSLSTSTILNKMGYHRNLPRSMVFAPRAMGGVGMCNLQSKMETQQILILLRHLRAATP